MNHLQSLSARVREYLTPSVYALVSDLERKAAELEGAVQASRVRANRLQDRAASLARRARDADTEAARAERIAARVRELIA